MHEHVKQIIVTAIWFSLLGITLGIAIGSSLWKYGILHH